MKSNGNNGKLTQIEEFKIHIERCKSKKNIADNPWFTNETYWKLVADDLFNEANADFTSGNYLESAKKYHQSAHIYSVIGKNELAKKAYDLLFSKSLDKIAVINN